MAAKRIRPSEAQQDFGFLNEDSETDLVSTPRAPLFSEVTSGADAPEENFPSSESIIESEKPAVTGSEIVPPALEVSPLPGTESGPLADPGLPIDAAPAAPAVSQSAAGTAAASAGALGPAIAAAPAAVAEVPGDVDKRDSEPIAIQSSDHVSRKLFVGVAGYAIALTLLFLALLLTGRMSLFGNHALESLPDLRPLAPNEFRKVPDGVDLPDGHVLRMGESRRFGDVIVTPVRVTIEPLKFQAFNSGVPEAKLTTKPVLHLWVTFENVGDYAFPPFDAGLMSNRTPPDSSDETTLANTFLTVGVPSADKSSARVLNYLQTMENFFVITGQESGRVLPPDETLTTFAVSSEDIHTLAYDATTSFVWRIQFRKGVHVASGYGVTTLIDVRFSGAEIATAG